MVSSIIADDVEPIRNILFILTALRINSPFDLTEVFSSTLTASFDSLTYKKSKRLSLIFFTLLLLRAPIFDFKCFSTCSFSLIASFVVASASDVSDVTVRTNSLKSRLTAVKAAEDYQMIRINEIMLEWRRRETVCLALSIQLDHQPPVALSLLIDMLRHVKINRSIQYTRYPTSLNAENSEKDSIRDSLFSDVIVYWIRTIELL